MALAGGDGDGDGDGEGDGDGDGDGEGDGNLLLLRPLFFYLGALQDSVNVWRLKRVVEG